MSPLYRISRRFHHRYRGVVILTLAVILLTLATPMRAHAAAGGTAEQQFAIGVKLLAATGDTAATNHDGSDLFIPASSADHWGWHLILKLIFQHPYLKCGATLGHTSERPPR